MWPGQDYITTQDENDKFSFLGNTVNFLQSLGWTGRAGTPQAVMSYLYMCSPPQWKGVGPPGSATSLANVCFHPGGGTAPAGVCFRPGVGASHTAATLKMMHKSDSLVITIPVCITKIKDM